MTRARILLVLAAALPASAVPAQSTPSSCAAHHAGVDARGDEVMGFDHAKTTHHFTLTKSGGVIAVSANDAADTESIDAIRGHLSHIAHMFTDGHFDAPMLIHDTVPPGVPEMKRDRRKIRWTYEETPEGGRVIAATKDDKALAAIHDFLRFQIEDHRTGDDAEVRPQP